MKKIFLLLFLISFPFSANAQDFSRFIGSTKQKLFNSLGKPILSKPNGDQYIYQYKGNEHGEVFTYATKNEIVIMAIQSFPGLTLSQAIEKRDEMILFYMSQGYFKQGTQAGLTILKKNQKMRSIGYMTSSDNTYITLITAYN